MPEAAPVSTPIRNSGHTIFYRAGDDTAADRHNIALIARICRLSTTPVFGEIFYHTPLRLSSWVSDDGNLRYTRIRSASDFALSERIAAAQTDKIVVVADTVLAHQTDLWQLLGLSSREAYVVLHAGKSLRRRGENSWSFALKSARLDLARYTGISAGNAAMISLNRTLLPEGRVNRIRGAITLKFFADLLCGESPVRPHVLRGRSSYLAGESRRYLATLASTGRAYRAWRSNGRFPYWFTYRNPLWHVAQLASYLALLVLPLTLSGSLILFGFALVISSGYTFSGLISALPLTRKKIRQLPEALRQFAARVVLLLIG